MLVPVLDDSHTKSMKYNRNIAVIHDGMASYVDFKTVRGHIIHAKKSDGQ